MAQNRLLGENITERPMLEDTHTDVERKRGVLTKKDREYLLGNITYESQQERNRRQHIRRRVKNSIIDFSLLDRLESRDRKQIIASLRNEAGKGDDQAEGESQQLLSGLTGIARFLYLASTDAGIPFSEILKEGIRQAEKERTGQLVADVDLNIEYLSTDPHKIDDVFIGLDVEMDSLSEEEREEVQGHLRNALNVLEKEDSSNKPGNSE
ncbi:hypothetical protein ACFQE1_03375 [Halobium palmae]|uniref:Domain of unknown function domain-containing protein n=1 Tax=Halobium palmae TaxID=1776492 RepID=A0ABD5RVU4_9EURY